MTQIRHIAFIMDGNRRYAESLGLDKTEGHKKGLENLYTIADYCYAQGVTEISVFAFSTENWNRSQREVEVLLGLVEELVTTQQDEFLKREVRVRFIGDLSRFTDDLQTEMRALEQQTMHFSKTLNICLSYGGRDEIVAAALAFARSGKTRLTTQEFEKYLWSGDMSDPDMVVRTGGYQRLSGFLLWKASYSELYFTDTLWPALSTQEVGNFMKTYKESVRINKGV